MFGGIFILCMLESVVAFFFVLIVSHCILAPVSAFDVIMYRWDACVVECTINQFQGCILHIKKLLPLKLDQRAMLTDQQVIFF